MIETYCDCARLKSYVKLNHEGIRKIVKKLDKRAGGLPRQPAMLSRLDHEPFWLSLRDLAAWSDELEMLCGHPEAVHGMRAAAKRACAPQHVESPTPRVWAIGFSALMACGVGVLLPQLDAAGEFEHERRCATVLTGIVML